MADIVDDIRASRDYAATKNTTRLLYAAADEIEKLRYRLNYMEERFGRIDWDGHSVPNGVGAPE